MQIKQKKSFNAHVCQSFFVVVWPEQHLSVSFVKLSCICSLCCFSSVVCLRGIITMWCALSSIHLRTWWCRLAWIRLCACGIFPVRRLRKGLSRLGRLGRWEWRERMEEIRGCLMAFSSSFPLSIMCAEQNSVGSKQKCLSHWCCKHQALI